MSVGVSVSAWPGPPATSFVGREAELELLARLVGDADGRLVTIVGPGGCGKTRLAMEAAGRLGGGFADRTAFVDLTSVRGAEGVLDEIVRSLGFVGLSGGGPVDRLVAGLGLQHRLVVVDNFEHLVEAAALVAEVARRCPRSVFVVTSRRRLNLIGEVTVTLPALAVPEARQGGGVDGLASVESVVMFCDRARAVGSRFVDDEATLAAIGEICRRLDGLPLAIELTAAYTRLLPPAALLARLEDAEREGELVLGGRGPTDASPQHRTMRETVRWSYDLLEDRARRLLRQVAVFEGGWTLEALEEVCAGDSSSFEFFDALVELVDLHLVEPVGQLDGDQRFRLLETVRLFAVEQLEEHGEAEAMATRHADYFVALAERAGQGLESRERQRWSMIVDRELPNMRAALERLAGTGRWADGLRAVVALQPYWLARGPTSEARRWLERFAGGEVDAVLRAVAESWAIRMALEWEHARDGAIGVDVVDRLRRTREVLATVDRASEWLRVTEHLVAVLRLRGDLEEAAELIDDAVGRHPAPEYAWRRADLLELRVGFTRDLESPDVARVRIQEMVDVMRAAGHDGGRVGASVQLVLVSGGTIEAARREIQDSFDLAMATGHRRHASAATAVAGALALRDGDLADAAKWFRTGIDLGMLTGIWFAVGWGMMGITSTVSLAGDPIAAARLHGSLLAQMPTLRPMTPAAQIKGYDRRVESVAAELGEEAFARECRVGQGRDWPQAVEDAKQLADRLMTGSSRAPPLAEPARTPRRGPRARPDLSKREREILQWLVDGRTNKDIAAGLGLSAKTVMHHTGRVYRKLGVRGRADAVAHALREGLVD